MGCINSDENIEEINETSPFPDEIQDIDYKYDWVALQDVDDDIFDDA